MLHAAGTPPELAQRHAMLAEASAFHFHTPVTLHAGS